LSGEEPELPKRPAGPQSQWFAKEPAGPMTSGSGKEAGKEESLRHQ